MKSHRASFRDMIDLPENESRGIKPGWAVKDSDGEWICYAHGYFSSKDPFYADRSQTREGAEITVRQAMDDGFKDLEIVVAWEPYCAHLLFDIDQLKKANRISPRTLFDLTFELENVLATLRDTAEAADKAPPQDDDE